MVNESLPSLTFEWRLTQWIARVDALKAQLIPVEAHASAQPTAEAWPFPSL